MFQWNLSLNGTEYYQLDVDLHVWRCPEETYQKDSLSQNVHAENEDVPNTILKEYLGPDIFNFFVGFFSPHTNQETIKEECKHVQGFQYHFQIFPLTVVYWGAVIVGCLISLLVVLSFMNKFFHYVTKKRQETVVEKVVKQEQAELVETKRCAEIQPPEKTFFGKTGVIVALAWQQYIQAEPSAIKRVDISEFLQCTIDDLLIHLDELLLKRNDINGVGNDTSQVYATPRPVRRSASVRSRSRLGSSPGFSLSSEITSQIKNPQWLEFEWYFESFGWKEPRLVDLEEQKCSELGKKLLNYQKRLCSLKHEQWKASILVVSYTLMLLQKEFEQITLSSKIHFVAFFGTGLATKGLQVTKASHFDIHFVLQMENLSISDVMLPTSDNKIPQGKIMLSIKNHSESFKSSPKLVQAINVNGMKKQCLSSSELLLGAEELVDIALQNLYTRSRILMDQLPFQIKRAATADLVLTLDTKGLFGLGVQEIKINMIPSLPLPVMGWYQAAQIYAVPVADMNSFKQNTVVHTPFHPEFIWSLSFGDLDDLFQSNVQLKMKMAGVDSCHKTVLQILLVLLTTGARNNLLYRGELTAQQITTVVNFLLLESCPGQWHYQYLPDRFSDCIHFLRSALHHGRLPNFFDSPHLREKMPFLKIVPILNCVRQEHLLVGIKQEYLEKSLAYIEQSLQDSGLTECVKDKYSEDMWEYEFFVFN
ncbi:hypothetical protein ACJMK2_044665 [Sinanodonta woodiana]|uniref:Mab-21-like HhH/H2TH-like domain-containing protein n=1 Tax=Sinanodonta woodiana TaxID=1069815 RepID=A0ABD3W3Z1_SINWO